MKRLPFIPQLDSFRFFAVLLVIIFHWLPKYDYIPLGIIGVTFFFVLSGYLISSNLLFLKKSVTEGEFSVVHAFKVFYIRRTLRIFPLYYFVIFLILLASPKIFEGNVVWYISYLPNFLVFCSKSWPGMLSHFWSLGVEEQFYLLWPLLIFTIRWNRLKYLFPTIIVLSVVIRAIYFSLDISHSSPLPWNNFDAFGIGAALAYFPFSGFRNSLSERIPLNWGICTCAILFVLFNYLRFYYLDILFVSGFSFFLIRNAEKGYSGFAGRLLDFPFFQYLGRISYGLYIYHNFMPWIWRCLTSRETLYPLPIRLLNKTWTNKPIIALPAQFLLLVIISSLSWYLLEKPIIKLKDTLIPKAHPPVTA